ATRSLPPSRTRPSTTTPASGLRERPRRCSASAVTCSRRATSRGRAPRSAATGSPDAPAPTTTEPSEWLRVAPLPLERQPPRVRRDELVDRVRTPRARSVRADRRRALQQRRRPLPEALDALGAREQRVVAQHRVVD